MDVLKLAVIRTDPASRADSELPTSVAVSFMDGRYYSWHVRPAGRARRIGQARAEWSLRETYRHIHCERVAKVASNLGATIHGYTLVADDEVTVARHLERLFEAGGIAVDRVPVAGLREVINTIDPEDARVSHRLEAALRSYRPFEGPAYEVSRCIGVIRTIAGR